MHHYLLYYLLKFTTLSNDQISIQMRLKIYWKGREQSLNLLHKVVQSLIILVSEIQYNYYL